MLGIEGQTGQYAQMHFEILSYAPHLVLINVSRDHALVILYQTHANMPSNMENVEYSGAAQRAYRRLVCLVCEDPTNQTQSQGD